MILFHYFVHFFQSSNLSSVARLLRTRRCDHGISARPGRRLRGRARGETQRVQNQTFHMAREASGIIT